MTRQPTISPKLSNSLRSQLSSMLQLRLPTNRFLMPSSAGSSVFVFLTTGSVTSSALRFLEGASASSLSDSESEESESESASESEESSESSEVEAA